MSTHREPTAVGALIAYYRNKAGLTQAELSEKVGMSQEWTSQVERGRIRRPRVDVLMRISKVLDAPLDQLVTATGYGSAAGVLGRVIPEEIEDPDVARAFIGLRNLSSERLRQVQAVIDGLTCLDRSGERGDFETGDKDGEGSLAGDYRQAG